MQKFIKLRIFRLLSDTSQNEDTTSQLEESCDEFALKVLTRLHLETNPMELYYSLGFVHLKLAGIYEQLSGKQEKKSPENNSQIHVFGRFRYASFGMANYYLE